MKLYTLKKDDTFLAVEGKDGKLYPLCQLGICYKDMNELIDNITAEQRAKINEFVNAPAADAKAYAKDEVEICAPILVPKQDVLCLGINYLEHAEETNAFPDGKRPETIYFAKRVNEFTGPFAAIPSHSDFTKALDYESELAVIVGCDCVGLTPENAMDAVFGYAVMNDVSARDIQMRHQQWHFGKSLEGFAPLGPCIVTPDEISDINDLAITCRVNGEQRQCNNTKNMIQSISGALVELTAGMKLKAGTVIATGTPGGVGVAMKPPCFLKHGDVVECEVAEVGCIRNVVD